VAVRVDQARDHSRATGVHDLRIPKIDIGLIVGRADPPDRAVLHEDADADRQIRAVAGRERGVAEQRPFHTPSVGRIIYRRQSAAPTAVSRRR
jgi:hypothetical protein